MDIAELLTFTKQQGASDLHLSAGLPPMIRLHGSLRRLKMDPLSKEEIHKMLYGVLTEEQRKRFEKDMELDFPYQVNGRGTIQGQCVSTRKRRRCCISRHPFTGSHPHRIEHATHPCRNGFEGKGTDSCHRTHGKRKIDDAGRHGQSHQRKQAVSYHYR